MFTILLGLPFFLQILTDLDSLTRPSDIYLIGKALRWDSIVISCSKPPSRRDLTNAGRLPRSSLLPKLFLERRDFLFAKKCYCVFVKKYLLCFLKCILTTNIAVKKPLYYGQVYATVIQTEKTDASMTFFRCIFWLLGSHINRDSAICSILCSKPVPAMGDHPALWLWRDNGKAKGIEIRGGKRINVGKKCSGEAFLVL